MISTAAGAAARPLLPLARRFLHHVDAEGSLRPGQRVLVAFSGGLDSTVLLHLLRFAARELRLELSAAHFDHALRASSAADADWVAGVCRAWRVPLVRGRCARQLSGETAARTARYAFLRAAAERAAATHLLTAHHADDQLETLLFRLARGTGLHGLAGIPERNGPLLRPLLPFRRSELQEYAAAARLSWRDDESNRSLAPARNRIRHRLLPAIERAHAGAAERLLALSRVAADAEKLWSELLPALAAEVVLEASPGEFQLARPLLQEYHPQTRARVVRYLLRRMESRPTRAGTRTAMEFITSGGSGSRVQLADGLELGREFDRIVLRRRAAGTRTADRPVLIPAAGEGAAEAWIGGVVLEIRWGREAPLSSRDLGVSLDPSRLHFPLVLRGWLPGDRIRLGYGTKKLKKLLAERRIGRHQRHVLPVLAEQAGDGRVLWVAGVAKAAGMEPAGDAWQVRVRHGESR